jgi:hypothetical protein
MVWVERVVVAISPPSTSECHTLSADHQPLTPALRSDGPALAANRSTIGYLSLIYYQVK